MESEDRMFHCVVKYRFPIEREARYNGSFQHIFLEIDKIQSDIRNMLYEYGVVNEGRPIYFRKGKNGGVEAHEEYKDAVLATVSRIE